MGIHDIFHTGLYSSLLQSSIFFLTYCSTNIKLLQIIDKQFNSSFRKHFQDFYSEGLANHSVAFLNTDSQVFFPALNALFHKKSTNMFKFDEYKVHLTTESCSDNPGSSSEKPCAIPLHLFPKWEKRGRYVLKEIRAFLDSNNCLAGNMFFFMMRYKKNLKNIIFLLQEQKLM